MVGDIYRESAAEIADSLADMPDAPARARQELFLAILVLLRALRRRLYQALWEDIRVEVQATASRFEDLSSVYLENVIAREHAGAFGYLDRSLNSIQTLASSLRRDVGGLHLRSALGSSNVPAAERRRKLRERLVAILATNGRVYRYEPGYYAELVKTSASDAVTKTATLEQARVVGSDLVVIAGPSSEHGFCDRMVGKVFSVSGTHAVAKPLANAFGGPPWHPRCKHWLEVFDESSVTPEELAVLADTEDLVGGIL